jgi:hypothetical protein
MHKITLLLTTTVFIQPKTQYLFQRDPQVRLNAYLKAIKQWLDKTDFNIVLVDNSGYEFNELSDYKIKCKDRFQIISFVEENLKESVYITNCTSKGSSEMFAIDYAYYNSELIKNSEFVIKITGRFYVEDFQKYLEEINIFEYDSICQNDRMRCELVGCKTKYFHKLFSLHLVSKENIVRAWSELVFKERLEVFFDKTHVCKELQIEETLRGGCTTPYTNL